MKPGVAVLALLLALIGAGHVCPASAERIGFHIPAGQAAATLPMFAAQANMNVLFQTDEVTTQPTHAVLGNLEPIQALALMLAGSGLRYRFQVPDSVLVIAERTGPHFEGTDSAPAVTVTGTLMHTAFASGRMALIEPYVILTRRYFTAGGFQTVGDVIRSLPQSFGGGLNVGVIFAGGSQNVTSQSAASTVNLRGFGSDSTMVLVNGQRLAATEGSAAVDVTIIPLAAVERIEISTGSASALFGSDAVAGVVNIILRTDFQGVELSSAVGFATEGGNFLHHYSAVAGDAIGGLNLFATADCAWQREIDSQQRAYVPKDIVGTTLMPGIQHCSTVFSAAGSLSRDWEGSVLGAYTKRFAYQAESVTVASTSATASTRSDVAQYAVNGVLKWHLPQSWTATFSGNWSADDITTPERVTQSGLPDMYLGDRFDNHLWSGQAIASGPLGRIGVRAPQLAIGVGHSQQGFLFTTLPVGKFGEDRQRRIDFAFAESVIPLVLSAFDARGPPTLALDVAVRTERYSDVGRATNAKMALQYKPSSSVAVSASWGTSFRAPSLLQLYGTPQALLEFVPDNPPTSVQSLALLRFGGNSSLTPEKATDAVVGLTFTPEALPDASVQINYYNIFYRHRIEAPTLNTGDPLSDRNVAPFVTLTPSLDEVKQIEAQSQFIDLTGGLSPGETPALIVDDRNQNFARQKASGIDLLSKYAGDTAFGRLDIWLNVAYLDLQQQVTNGSGIVPLSGTVFNPPVLRGRFGVGWSYRHYLSSLFVNYTGGSDEVSAPGESQVVTRRSIGSWTTLDGQIGVVFNGGGHRGNTRVTLAVQNLLDRHPPLISIGQVGLGGIDYDSTNASPVGRFLALQVTQAW